MSRELLSEATSIHEGPVPTYLLDQIAGQVNDSSADKITDFLLGRMAKSNMNVKLKAMQVINYCLKSGNGAFSHYIRQEEDTIRGLSNFQGTIDPAYGDEKNRRVRMAALEMLNYLGLPTNFAAGSSNVPPPSYMPQAYCSGQSNPPANSWGNPSNPPPGQQMQWGNPASQAQPPQYGRPNQFNSNTSTNTAPGPWRRESGSSAAQYGSNPSQHGNNPSQYGNPPAPYRDSPAPTQQYGSNPPQYDSNQPQYGNPPAPYRDQPPQPAPQVPQYGNNSSQYGNGPQSYGGNQGQQYGGSSNSFNPPQYGNNPSEYGQSNGPPSFNTQDSWRGGGGNSNPLGSKSTSTGGTWSSSGYEKKEPTAQDMVPTRWSSSRDNRPTVLVGPKTSLFGSQKPIQPHVGGSGINRMGSSNMGGGGFNPPPGPAGLMPTNTLHSRNPTSLPFSDKPKSAIEQTLDDVKKKGFMLKDMWDRRNMDKSMASSLAEHDDYVSTSAVLDSRGQSYQPQPKTVFASPPVFLDTGFDWEYERSLIDDLCPPGGLARAPPPENLRRFVDLAKTLDMNVLGDLLLDKLEDDSWQVRLKALCVWESLLEAPGCSHYGEWLEENIELLQHVGQDPKLAVATKAKRVLQLLGIEPSLAPVATSQSHQHKAVSRHPPSANVDLLAMNDLSLGGAASASTPPQQPAPVAHQPTPVAHQPAPMAHQPLSPANLLDLSFSPVKSAAPTPNIALDPLSLAAPNSTFSNSNPSLPPDASRSLGDFGKDLFTLVNSPRSNASNQTNASQEQSQPQPEKSAFSFM